MNLEKANTISILLVAVALWMIGDWFKRDRERIAALESAVGVLQSAVFHTKGAGAK